MQKIDYKHNANPNDIVKIQVHIGMKDVSRWAEIRLQVEDWAVKNNFIVNSIIPQVSYVEGKRQKLVKSVRRNDNEYLESFVKRTGADSKVAEVGKQIIEIV